MCFFFPILRITVSSWLGFVTYLQREKDVPEKLYMSSVIQSYVLKTGLVP